MTDKELRKLRRIELLELLVEQGEEMERLRGQLQKAQEALQERTIVIQKAGSLAEAALRLNGVFTAADQAARDYVDSLRTMEAQQRAKVASIEKEAREKPTRCSPKPGKSAAPWSRRPFGAAGS